MENTTHEKLKVLSTRLLATDRDSICFDSWHNGSLESVIADAKIDVMHRIGDMLIEILNGE